MRSAFRRFKAALWERRGRIPHAYGFQAARWFEIERAIASDNRIGSDGGGFDERVVEYAWLFERLRNLGARERVLDAGSVLNHGRILAAWRRAGLPPLSIVTLGYEGHAEVATDVRYEFADLRMLPYRDAWFPVVVSLSTLEHVGMDNAVYGAAAAAVTAREDPGEESALALRELGRVTRPGGTILVSLPFGKRSHRGWSRIFDAEDLERLVAADRWARVTRRFYRAHQDGWRECSPEEAQTAGYNDAPGRPGEHTAPPWVAAAEAVALLELTRL